MLALMHPSHGAPPDGAHRRPPSRTKWTRLVHPSVLIGHVSSLCPPPAGPRRLAVAGPSPAPLPPPAPQKSIPKVNSLPPTYVPLPQAACQSAPRPAPRAPPARPLSPHHLRPQNELPAQRPRPHAESTTLPGRQPEQMERLPCAARYRAVARAGLWNRPASGDEAEAGPNRPASGDEAEAGSSAGAGECRASPLCAV